MSSPGLGTPSGGLAIVRMLSARDLLGRRSNERYLMFTAGSAVMLNSTFLVALISIVMFLNCIT